MTGREEQHEVKPGGVWADADPRSAGRTLRVDKVLQGVVTCTVLTDMDERPAGSKTTVGRETRISLRRFRPTSTGYRYVGEYEDDAATAAGTGELHA